MFNRERVNPKKYRTHDIAKADIFNYIKCLPRECGDEQQRVRKPETLMNKISIFFSELLRRKVVRLMGAYFVVLWLLAQGVASIFPAFGLPAWSVRVFIIGGLAFVPLLGWLSWRYNFVPPQLELDAGNETGSKNPGLIWAQRRHDNTDAGFVLVKWQTDAGKPMEKRFFKALSLGRDPNNDVRLFDERVSRHHAVLWAENGAWHIKDSSTNGTYLNHAKISATVRLPDSCELQLHPNGPIVSVHVDKPTKTMMS